MANAFIILLLVGSGCAQAAKPPVFTMRGDGADTVMAYIDQEGDVSRWFPTAKHCTLSRIEPAPQPLDGPELAPNVKELTASWSCEGVSSLLRVSFKLTNNEVSAVDPHYGK
ncbi:hypothetical protein C7E20_12125 [Sphingobium sp. AEW4]|nr:hypothetical protein C7E20_12125 [Sphingobium sp. AEW4]